MILTVPAHEYWVAIAFLPILAATAFCDLRDMKIPNKLSLIGLGLFAASFPVLGYEAWLLHLVAGVCVFAVCFGLFAVGWFGGGDAKILPVTVLFVPSGLLQLYMFSFSAAMLLGMAAMWCVRQQYTNPDSSWVSLKPNAHFPMGISIAASLPLALIASRLLPEFL